MSKRKFLNTIKLTELEQERLLSALDESASGGNGTNRRQHERHRYRARGIALIVEHPGGGESQYLVSARNLSVGGIGLLHGGFLHSDTRCVVVLEQINGARKIIEGAVVNCRHVRGPLHEVGVRFLKEVNPDDYLRPEDKEAPESDSGNMLANGGDITAAAA